MVLILLQLILLGVLWYLIDTYVPMAEPIRVVIRVVVVLAVCFWLLNAFGIVSIPSRLR